MNLITNKKDIIALISEVSATGKKLDGMIWVAAASIVQHIDKHGDVTLAQDLIDAMPKGSRVNALIAYFEKVAKVEYDTDAKAVKFRRDATTNMELATSKSWVEYKPEQPYSGYDLHAVIRKAIMTADKALKETKPERKAMVKVDEDELTALKEFATKLGIDLSAK